MAGNRSLIPLGLVTWFTVLARSIILFDHNGDCIPVQGNRRVADNEPAVAGFQHRSTDNLILLGMLLTMRLASTAVTLMTIVVGMGVIVISSRKIRIERGEADSVPFLEDVVLDEAVEGTSLFAVNVCSGLDHVVSGPMEDLAQLPDSGAGVELDVPDTVGGDIEHSVWHDDFLSLALLIAGLCQRVMNGNHRHPISIDDYLVLAHRALS